MKDKTWEKAELIDPLSRRPRLSTRPNEWRQEQRAENPALRCAGSETDWATSPPVAADQSAWVARSVPAPGRALSQ